ncbi:MAG TPA: thioredoxin domain-containing protein [Solirubrobacterales bacterium]|nr:thioredoxin domain-containing protein [Solirubrobacterales bacterium]
MGTLEEMANLLAEETSPYLLQHKENPVDWRPWGPEALEQAVRDDKPILLSIGYSACHWCHVMERESFEDEQTARLINESFVPIKVDREERPDVDDIYMEAVQGMTGQGGWPLTVFLDPDGVPFYGGTYFPPEPRQGMPSFSQVLEATAGAYRNQREELREASARIRESLGAVGKVEQSQEPLDESILARAVSGLQGSFDRANGGFGGAPKFPPASTLEFLLDRGQNEPARLTLDKMMHGGIYDQLGGGFHRYSVDATWLVPHFEKMLYDNALLARAYLHGWQVMGEERWRRVCEETLDWALREMRGPEGGFHSALDADSEGEEGRFYVWEEEEMWTALGDADLSADAIERVLGYWGVSPAGNFEGRNVLHLPLGASAQRPAELDDARTALYAWRDRRVRPGVDDKRICSWNALMIAALADAGAALGRQDHVDAACACARFVLESMRDSEGRLRRTWKNGDARLNAYLEDHAFLVEALLRLYEATLEVRWFDAARETADAMIERFADDERGGFFTTSNDHEELIARRKDVGDHPIPSGNSSAAYGLLRLAALTGVRDYEERAVGTMRLFAPAASRHPDAFGHLLQAIDFHISPVREVALVAPTNGAASAARLDELARVVRSAHRPHVVLAGGLEGSERPELLRERPAVEGKPAAYVCEHFACKAPVTEPSELAAALG